MTCPRCRQDLSLQYELATARAQRDFAETGVSILTYELAAARALLEDVEERTYDGRRIPVNLCYRITAFLHPKKVGA